MNNEYVCMYVCIYVYNYIYIYIYILHWIWITTRMTMMIFLSDALHVIGRWVSGCPASLSNAGPVLCIISVLPAGESPHCLVIE